MSLPRLDDKAALRALERKCSDPKSVVSKRIVRQLAAEPLSYKEDFMYNFTTLGLGNLVRCALEAQMSADFATEEEAGSVSMIRLAAANGSITALKALLAGGANTELADEDGVTALAAAAREGHLSCLQLLLDAGANANAQDGLGNTPLMKAVICKQVECARALAAAAHLALTNRQGVSAFHAAVMTASDACFELLLPLCDVDMRTAPGMDPSSGEAVPEFDLTALHIACQRGLLLMCKALLGRGADRMARDCWQFTPLHWAAGCGHLSCVTLPGPQSGLVRASGHAVSYVRRLHKQHPARVGLSDDAADV